MFIRTENLSKASIRQFSCPKAEATNFRVNVQDRDQELQVLDVGERDQDVPLQVLGLGL